MQARQLLGPRGPLARALSGYEVRDGQLRMAEAVQRALHEDQTLLVEAGTGTGKTLAYLVPAILSEKRVVVSTGTKTLQDQIMDHDLPLLQAALGVPVGAACMKGLANYLCLRRFHEFVSSAGADDAHDGLFAAEGSRQRQPRQGVLAQQVQGSQPAGARGHAHPRKKRRRKGGRKTGQISGLSSQPSGVQLLVDWQSRTQTGERADFAELPENDPIWSEVNSGSESRIGPKCAYYDRCYVTEMRAKAEAAQLVVVNHHLFFADLAVRGGAHGASVIPDYEAVIFDEAHQLEDVATEFFGVSVSNIRMAVLLRDTQRALLAARLLPEALGLLESVRSCTSRFFASLPRPSGGEANRVGLELSAMGPFFELDNALEGLSAYCSRQARAGESVAQMALRSQKVRDDLAAIAQGTDRRYVTWMRVGPRSTAIGASPVDVSSFIRERLFYREQGIVLTSATLSTEGSFAFVKERLGIDYEARELIVPSPFDYRSNAALYVPAELPEPRDPRYSVLAAERIGSLVHMTEGGAFVLCTSRRAMRELAQLCRSQLEHPIYVQGEAPSPTLLERFRNMGNAVLFATASFWQGVDVPGPALRLVVIDKLPFDVPTDPLIQARCRLIRERGGDAFTSYSVPAAALSLKQGFGRLIRSSRDRGIVAILDRRLLTKPYGKVFLTSLPPAWYCRSLSDLIEFWKSWR